MLHRLRKSINKNILRRKLRRPEFTIISNDCWGGEVYKYLGLPYSTPFVGVLVLSPCYIKLLENLRHYLAQPLQFKPRSKYGYIAALKKRSGVDFPIGVLGGDVEIHFFHYTSEREAMEKWVARVGRINWDNIYFKYDCNKDLATDDDLRRFDRLDCAKIAFGVKEVAGVSSLVTFRKWNLDARKFFFLSLETFDITDWLNGGTGKPTLFYRFCYHLFQKGTRPE